jgi:hypothetical protein
MAEPVGAALLQRLVVLLPPVSEPRWAALVAHDQHVVERPLVLEDPIQRVGDGPSVTPGQTGHPRAGLPTFAVVLGDDERKGRGRTLLGGLLRLDREQAVFGTLDALGQQIGSQPAQVVRVGRQRARVEHALAPALLHLGADDAIDELLE